MSEMVVVHIAVDGWRGGDLTSSLIGAWSATRSSLGTASPHDVLDAVRSALGASWAPATPEEISQWHAAFAADPSVPWEQISLF